MPQQTPTVGDRVGVPWGLDVLEGVIVRTYQSPSGTRAVVSVDVPGADNEPESRRVTLPVVDLRPIGEGDELEAPGSWVNEYQFSKALHLALARAVHRLAESGDVEVETEPRLGHQRLDALVRLGDHLVVIEAKTTAHSSAAVNQLKSYVDGVRNLNPDASVGGMLVLQADPPNHILRESSRAGLAVVTWSNSRDDPKLVAALASTLK